MTTEKQFLEKFGINDALIVVGDDVINLSTLLKLHFESKIPSEEEVLIAANSLKMDKFIRYKDLDEIYEAGFVEGVEWLKSELTK